MLTVWMIWVQSDDDWIWLEAAWTDDMTIDNPSGWIAEVDRVRKLAYENKYTMRIQRVKIPIDNLFDIPTVKATEA